MPGIHSSGGPSTPSRRVDGHCRPRRAGAVDDPRRPRRLIRLDGLAVRPEVVVALDPVLDHDLPVPRRLEALRRHGDHLRPPPRRELAAERPANDSCRIDGVAREVDQHEALPDRVPQRAAGTTPSRSASSSSGAPISEPSSRYDHRWYGHTSVDPTPAPSSSSIEPRWAHTLASTRTVSRRAPRRPADRPV